MISNIFYISSINPNPSMIIPDLLHSIRTKNKRYTQDTAYRGKEVRYRPQITRQNTVISKQRRRSSIIMSSVLDADSPLHGENRVLSKDAILIKHPPDIPHISENFVPLSIVVSRLVENIYSGLVTLLETLPSSNDTSRKRKFLGFLIHARQQFIKLLVLTQWSRNAKDISKVIDVVAWLTGQKNCFSNVVWALKSVKQDLGAARLRNPDLATALEVFVLGAPRLSLFNYVPPKPLSPQQILDTLHDLNVLLSIRLVLAENIPPAFRNYKIANGRATFHVKGDYEVELGIADSARDSRFFLIDFRFVFKPESTVTPAIRATLERIGNEVLISKGLVGLYDYLHNFTLSYKLLIMQQQLVALAKGIWTGTLSVSYFPERQVISLQYWVEQRARRSIAEIGILQSKYIGVKWIPKDFPPETFALNQDEISAHKFLSQIITLHIQQLFSQIYSLFKSLQIYKASPDLITPLSDIKLRIALTPTKTTTMTVEHLTGRLTLAGKSDLLSSAEKAMNSQTDMIGIVHQLVNLRHLSVRQEVEQLVRDAGWEVIQILNIRADDSRNNYGLGVRQLSTIRQANWTPGWFVVVTITDSAASLWFSQLRPVDGGWTISWNEAINTDAIDLLCSPERLKNLAVLTSARITFHLIADGLTHRSIKFEFIQPPVAGPSLDLPALQFDPDTITKTAWAKSAFKVEYVPASQSEFDEQDVVIVTGAMEDSAVLNSISEARGDVVLDVQNGRFTLKLFVTSKNDVLESVLEWIYRIERAVIFIQTVQSFELELVEVTLTKMVFLYASELKMAISLASDVDLKISLARSNPHHQIKFFLQDVLDTDGLQTLITLLAATLPVLTVRRAIDNGTVYMLVRSVKHYRILYEQQRYAIDVMLKDRGGKIMVYITDSSADVAGYVKAEACAAIWNTNEKGMVGMGVGVACEVDVVEELLMRVHRAICPK
ncbi:mediator complex subunit MED14-domain-containing protein [Lipomyces arxii]|uniref:mediator complex subunit MED14-domain-containing protein n=1 Tax=Lipomyces arxii TaxID=56418 RepID=UPI0034CD0622